MYIYINVPQPIPPLVPFEIKISDFAWTGEEKNQKVEKKGCGRDRERFIQRPGQKYLMRMFVGGSSFGPRWSSQLLPIDNPVADVDPLASTVPFVALDPLATCPFITGRTGTSFIEVRYKEIVLKLRKSLFRSREINWFPSLLSVQGRHPRKGFVRVISGPLPPPSLELRYSCHFRVNCIPFFSQWFGPC